MVGLLVYKPGWTITVYETEFQGIWLAVAAEVEDSYHPGDSVPLRIKSPIPPMRSNADFLNWLRWRLERIEVHECHEWLRLKDDGKPLFDPHAEGADEPRDDVLGSTT